ncbi:MAG: YitT family protein [Lachnospiraceae bacterium]|nr:YitT family protein [Lachnospiraceae bacterium]
MRIFYQRMKAGGSTMSNKKQETHMVRERKLKERVRNYLLITVASIIYSAAVSLFLDPNSLAPGGVTGIAIILNRLIPVETGTLFLMINIPILLLGAWKFGMGFILSTIYSTVLISLFTNLFSGMGPLTTDPLLATLVGGSMMAVGIGWVFKAGATTGGTDIIVKLLRQKMPHLKTSRLFLAVDAVIVAASAFVFKDIDVALYAGLTVIVNSLVMDLVLYGRDEAKLVFIISDQSEQITKRMLEELDVGVTYIQGTGAFSGRDKRVIFCAVKKAMAPKTEEIVKEEDPRAFMIITSATEIYGEGYKSYFSEKL